MFESVESAQKAIEEIQGFELFEKPMQLAFAKTRSDATVKRVGNEEEFESHKRRRLAEKGKLLREYDFGTMINNVNRQEEGS